MVVGNSCNCWVIDGYVQDCMIRPSIYGVQDLGSYLFLHVIEYLYLIFELLHKKIYIYFH
jgi:hypothetical protein